MALLLIWWPHGTEVLPSGTEYTVNGKCHLIGVQMRFKELETVEFHGGGHLCPT